MMAVFTGLGAILGVAGIVFMFYSLCRPEKF